MDPVMALVVSAIAAGAVAGVGDTAKQAVRDAYAGLKNLISHKYADVDVSGLERKPDSESKRASLAEDLVDAGATADAELAAAAAAVLEVVRQHDPQVVVGVDVQGLIAEALKISDIASTGDGVRVADSKIAGAAEITGVKAGFTDPSTARS